MCIPLTLVEQVICSKYKNELNEIESSELEEMF